MGGILLVRDNDSIAEVPLEGGKVAVQISFKRYFLPDADLVATEIKENRYGCIDLDVHLMAGYGTGADSARDECDGIDPCFFEYMYRRFGAGERTVIKIPGIRFNLASGLVVEGNDLADQRVRGRDREFCLYRAANADLDFFARLVSGLLVAD